MKTISLSRVLWAILGLVALLFTACPTDSSEQDVPTAMPTTSLQAALSWLDSNAAEGWYYTIPLHADESITPKTLSYKGKKVSIILTAGESERTVSLSSTGALFTVEDGVTLTLQNNVTLQGRSDNTTSLVVVGSGGALEMENGAKITSNNNTASTGGGVFVYSGTFTKRSGVIYGSDGGSLQNSASNGKAAYVSSWGRERNSTAGNGVYLDSSVRDSTGGWEKW